MASLPVSKDESFLKPYDDGRATVTVIFDRATKRVAYIPESPDPFDFAEADFSDPYSGLSASGLSDGDALEEAITERSEAARQAGWSVVSAEELKRA